MDAMNKNLWNVLNTWLPFVFEPLYIRATIRVRTIPVSMYSVVCMYTFRVYVYQSCACKPRLCTYAIIVYVYHPCGCIPAFAFPLYEICFEKKEGLKGFVHSHTHGSEKGSCWRLKRPGFY